MTRPYHKSRKFGRGSRKCQQVRLVTGFDPQTFDEIIAYAEKNNVSLGGAVRDLVEFGLIDAATETAEAVE